MELHEIILDTLQVYVQIRKHIKGHLVTHRKLVLQQQGDSSHSAQQCFSYKGDWRHDDSRICLEPEIYNRSSLKLRYSSE